MQALALALPLLLLLLLRARGWVARRAFGGGSVSQAKKMRVAFLHPDLGIGGAERLVAFRCFTPL